MELRYRHVEAALRKVLDVKPRDVGAFRARLRHLRNIGVPRLPTPGRGQAIAYTQRQALELLIALVLLRAGHAPKSVMMLAPSIVRQSPYGQEEGGDDCYVILRPKREEYTIAATLGAFMEFIKTAPDAFMALNVSAFVAKLDPALKRALRSS